MACEQMIADIGEANQLRPGGGWHCVFAQPISQAPDGTEVTAARTGVRYQVVGGNTFPWTDELDPTKVCQALYNNGFRCLYMEVWENPPAWVVGNDDYVFIALYCKR